MRHSVTERENVFSIRIERESQNRKKKQEGKGKEYAFVSYC